MNHNGAWVKAQASQNNGGCVEWFRASSSGPQGNCAEAGFSRATASAVNNCAEAAGWDKPTASRESGCLETSFGKASASFANADCAESSFASASSSFQGDSVEGGGDHDCPYACLRDSKEGELSPEVLGDPGWTRTVLSYLPERWDGGRVVTFDAIPVADVPPHLVGVRNARKSVDPEMDQWFRVTAAPIATAEDEKLNVGRTLYFDQGEHDAWWDGVGKGEFTR
jgi:hypothetical protein